VPQKRKIKQLLTDLSCEEKELMLASLLEAIQISKHDKSLVAIEECLASWEATAELNKIPGLREKVLERYERLKRSGVIQ
jgi:hypothetical protein